MRKIKSISEAFSIQPAFITINPNKDNPRDDEAVEIKEEVIQVSDLDRITVYAGYNKKGKRLFQYLANSVNVHYF